MNVDISILEDELGFDSHLPCDSSMNEKFDECAYEKVTTKILFQRPLHVISGPSFYKSTYFFSAARDNVGGAWLHRPLDAGPHDLHAVQAE